MNKIESHAHKLIALSLNFIFARVRKALRQERPAWRNASSEEEIFGVYHSLRVQSRWEAENRALYRTLIRRECM